MAENLCERVGEEKTVHGKGHSGFSGTPLVRHLWALGVSSWSAFSVPVASKLGWWLLRCRVLCNEDTHGNEEPHSGTTEAG